MFQMQAASPEISEQVATTSEVGFRAVEGRNTLKVALRGEHRGDSSRAVSNNHTDLALVEVNQVIARENIKNCAKCLLSFPVYYKKVKEG